MFADDLTIFCRAKVEEVGALFDCFNKFNAWSGQAINFTKSSIYFSGNITIDLKRNICEAMRMKECNHRDTYLGL